MPDPITTPPRRDLVTTTEVPRTQSLAHELEVLGQDAALQSGSEAEKVQALRERALATTAGKLPAHAAAAYAGALLKASGVGAGMGMVALRAASDAASRVGAELNASIDGARSNIHGLEGRLEQLSVDNAARHQSSLQAFQAIRDQWATVFTDRHRHENDRVGAFFQIHRANGQQQRLTEAWRAYQAKQGEFRDSLNGLRAAEVTLVGALEAGGAARPTQEQVVLLFATRQQGLEKLLTNLEEQTALLEQLVAHASGTNQALRGLQAELAKELAQTKAWIAETRDLGVREILGYVAGLAGFVAQLSAAPAGIAVAQIANLLQSLLLKDVEGLRQEAEVMVWRTVGRLVTAGLIEAGVSEVMARTLVSGLRAAAEISAASERREAAALVTAGVRAGLGEGQRRLVDFLLQEASDALPVLDLVRSALAMPGLTIESAAAVVDALRKPTVPPPGSRSTSGVGAALAVLSAATA